MGWSYRNPLNGQGLDAGTLSRNQHRAPTPLCHVNDFDSSERRQTLHHLLASAACFGLPTAFLREVDPEFSLNDTRLGGESVSKLFRVLNLANDTARDTVPLSTEKPGGAPGIQTVYQESTRAWFQLKAKDPSVADVTKQATTYYQGASLQGGAQADDPAQVFAAAAANYVGHRAETWWLCFLGLALVAAGGVRGPAASKRVAELRRAYDRAMGERVFGFQETGGVRGVAAKRTPAIKPIGSPLKAFLDDTLLEGKIPDAFDDVEGFRKLINTYGLN